MTRPLRVRVEDLLGRRVVDRDGQPAGRIEEVRAERHGDDHEVTEFLLGPGALLERLNIAHLFGAGAPLRVARWDQIDIHRPKQPRLLCRVAELAEEPAGRRRSR